MIIPIDMPSNFPPFLRDGYGIDYLNDTSRTVMATGRSRIRRIYEHVSGSSKVSAMLDDSQAQLFEAWYLYALESSKWFNAKLKTPLGYDDVICRLVSTFDGPILDGCLWRYSFNIEIYEEQIISEEEYEAL